MYIYIMICIYTYAFCTSIQIHKAVVYSMSKNVYKFASTLATGTYQDTSLGAVDSPPKKNGVHSESRRFSRFLSSVWRRFELCWRLENGKSLGKTMNSMSRRGWRLREV